MFSRLTKLQYLGRSSVAIYEEKDRFRDLRSAYEKEKGHLKPIPIKSFPNILKLDDATLLKLEF